MDSTPSNAPTSATGAPVVPDEKGQVYLPDGTPLRSVGIATAYHSPEDYRSASAAWLEEAEDMRAARGGFVTHQETLAYSIAYGLQALLAGQAQMSGALAEALGWPQPGDVDPATIEG